MTDRLVVEVAPGVRSWGHGDSNLVLPAGELHEIDLADSDDGLRAAIAAAVAAGALNLVSGELPDDAVQSQEEGERRYALAQEAKRDLYAQRDRALLGKKRLPEVVVRSRDEVQDLADGGSALHAALLDEAPHNKQHFEVPARTAEDFRELAEQGSEYHAVLLDYEDRMAQAAQAALEEEL